MQKTRGGLRTRATSLELYSVWMRQTPAGAFEHVLKPKNAFINGKNGDADHARVLGVGWLFLVVYKVQVIEGCGRYQKRFQFSENSIPCDPSRARGQEGAPTHQNESPSRLNTEASGRSHSLSLFPSAVSCHEKKNSGRTLRWLRP